MSERLLEMGGLGVNSSIAGVWVSSTCCIELPIAISASLSGLITVSWVESRVTLRRCQRGRLDLFRTVVCQMLVGNGEHSEIHFQPIRHAQVASNTLSGKNLTGGPPCIEWSNLIRTYAFSVSSGAWGININDVFKKILEKPSKTTKKVPLTDDEKKQFGLKHGFNYLIQLCYSLQSRSTVRPGMHRNEP